MPSIYSSARTELDKSPVCPDHAGMISSFVRALVSRGPRIEAGATAAAQRADTFWSRRGPGLDPGFRSGAWHPVPSILFIRGHQLATSLEGRDESKNKRRNHVGMVLADRRPIKFGARG